MLWDKILQDKTIKKELSEKKLQDDTMRQKQKLLVKV